MVVHELLHNIRYGNPDYVPSSSVIPDWTPQYYKKDQVKAHVRKICSLSLMDSSQVELPPFVPDTKVSREEIANQYTAISRLDQGKIQRTIAFGAWSYLTILNRQQIDINNPPD